MTNQNVKPLRNKAESVHPASDESRLNALLDKLYGLHPKLIDLSLDRVLRFLDELGNPHLKLPPVIHVAGTNGKGSTIAILRAILEAHGKRVHVATSPHLIRINERIVLAGEEIDDETLCDLIIECMTKNKGQDITFFEMIMAISFLAFSRVKADFCLLETGMGGRLDATNVIPNPAATIITSIGLDHQDFLGDGLSDIAAEKAGIMKPDVPCIIGMQSQDAIAAGVMDVFQSIGLSTGAPLHRFGAEWVSEPHEGHMRFASGSIEYRLQKPNLIGSHQIGSAGAAIEALRVIGALDLDPEKISTALGQIYWPGRLQRLGGPAFDGIKKSGWEIWIDGGHNENAGQALADVMKEWHANDSQKVHVILGMLTRKNAGDFVAPFATYVASITTIPVPDEPSSYEPHQLAGEMQNCFSGPVKTAGDVHQAVHQITQDFPEGGKITDHRLSLSGRPCIICRKDALIWP